MTRSLGTVVLALTLACTTVPPDAQVTTTAATEATLETGGPGDDPTTTTATTTTTAGKPAPAGSAQPADPILGCWASNPETTADGRIGFQDVTVEAGLIDPLTGIFGHAAVWADVNGDDLQDLFVGTFADRPAERYAHRGATGPSPDRLLIQGDGFAPSTGLAEMYSRTSGGAAADLDLDGDLDLVVSRNYRERVADEAPTQILRNDGGTLVPIEDSGLPERIGGRSVAILDYNLDGLPDIFITEDRWSGGSSVLLENLGGLEFEDATSRAGIPDDVHGLGVAAADFNGDGLADIFVGGSNRLFVADGEGGFTETDNQVFQWETFGREDDVAGVSVADLNRDGRLDIALGQHYNSTVDFGSRVPVRIYLNRGTDGDGMPRFEDVTDRTGLPGLATKAPHVEINDFDNDGWPDLLASASAADGAGPAVFRHEGLDGDIPTFSSPAGLGDARYWVASPTADYDRDGRLDVFLVEWDPGLPSVLLRNTTPSGNWLEVSVGPEHGFGIGWRIDVYDAGALVGAREITVTQGYSAGVSPIAHFGLGNLDEIDVVITPPGGAEPVTIGGVAANQHLRYPAGCG